MGWERGDVCAAPEMDLPVHQPADNEQPGLVPQLLEPFQHLQL